MPKFKNFKDRKGAADKAKNNLYVKLSRKIFVAAREGGPDQVNNFALKTAIANARAINMPVDNIDRAINKASGNLEGVTYEEITYEGYGPGGVAVLVECLTDNRKRSSQDVRAIFAKRDGNLGEPGCVGWMFDHKGVLTINRGESPMGEDDLMMIALDAGAEDMVSSEDEFEVITALADFEKVRNTLEAANVTFENAEISWVPQNTVTIAGEDAEKMLKMMDAFNEHDDVQNVFVNFEIEDEEMERIEGR